MDWLDINFDGQLDCYPFGEDAAVWSKDRIVFLVLGNKLKLYPTDRYSLIKEHFLHSADPEFFDHLQKFLVEEWRCNPTKK